MTDNKKPLLGLSLSELKEVAKSKDIKIVSSGVWTSSREEWEKVFSFAKNMEMEFISAEPSREDWDVVENLAGEYGIKLAAHNHPNENSYWKPEILLDYIGNRGTLLGSSADVGHFKRMGIDPVPALQQLQGRLIAMHFKDIAPQGEGVLGPDADAANIAASRRPYSTIPPRPGSPCKLLQPAHAHPL